MSRGLMESNKEEMRAAEVVEEVVDSKEEEVSDFKDAKGLGDPWERISGTEVAVKIASDGGESIFSMVSKDRNVLCSDPGHCCRPMLYLPLSNCCSLPPFDILYRLLGRCQLCSKVLFEVQTVLLKQHLMSTK